MKNIVFTLILLGVAILFPKTAHAYIDPGTGSYLWQILLGTLFGGVFAAKLYWKKIISVFKRTGKNDEKADKEN